jgi:hypothetical protein
MKMPQIFQKVSLKNKKTLMCPLLPLVSDGESSCIIEDSLYMTKHLSFAAISYTTLGFENFLIKCLIMVSAFILLRVIGT